MTIHDIEQGSVSWEVLRSQKITASEFDALVSPTGKVRVGDGVRSYLMKKLACLWLGGPLPSLNFWDASQGAYLEERARPAFTIETGLEVRTVGFITGDNPQIGCSPDGLVGEDCGLELKAPHIETHLRYLLDGILPPDHVAQVQGSIFVTGFSSWYFCSFRRNFPLFVLKVERDDKFQAALKTATDEFLKNLDEAYARLVEMNGGPPKHRSVPKTEEPLNLN